MESASKNNLSLVVGFIILAVMTSLLFILGWINDNTDEKALANHFIMMAYLVFLLLERLVRKKRLERPCVAILMVMLLVDAYSLNYEFHVFSPATTWYGISIFLLCTNMLAMSFFDKASERVKCLLALSSGAVILIPVMPAISMGFVYFAGLFGMILIGMGIVAFAPVLIIYYNTRIFYKQFLPVKKYRHFFFSGLSAVLLYVIIYCITYGTSLNRLERAYKSADTPGNDGQPGWVSVAQQLELTPMMNRILRTKITLDTFGDFAEVGHRFFDDNAHYDPLFVLASGIFSTTNIPEEDRLSILKILADKHHYDEERLWDGDDLKTTHVNTIAEIWPSNHIAYTEHTVTITNTNLERWRSASQEAIYTFHLPDGATVTSLSLWMGIHEVKGILTTREKATAAYRDVVGIQRRDPSVVHWREGNRVAVRVFPVTNDAPRKFKIGITAPLLMQKGVLTYQPGWFEGPGSSNATHDVRLQFEEKPIGLTYPNGFHSNKGNVIANNGEYRDNWELTFADPGLTNSAFMFDNVRYTLLPYHPAQSVFNPDIVYLDLNASWNYDEYMKLINSLRSKKLYVYQGEKWITVTTSNARQVFEERRQLRFTLFPFYRMLHDRKAIVVTAGLKSGPFLSDLSYDAFSAPLHKYLQQHHPVVYNIGDQVSPFIESLNASKQITLQKGSLLSLLSQLEHNAFLVPVKSPDRIDLPQAGISIAQSPDHIASKGPDHLARLFAYHSLLEESAKQPIDTNKLMAIAASGYVVSPVSSLLVLETQADYDKNKIDNNEIGLQNAAIRGHGSVPEPHEWALFILAVGILIYVRYEKLLVRRKNSAC